MTHFTYSRPAMDNTNSSAMSPDGSSVGVFSTERIGKLGYGLGFSIGIIFLIITILLASYLCARSNTANRPRPRPRQAGGPAGETRVADVEAGLDESTLMSYPKLLYSQAKLCNKGLTGSCCSICLGDYKETDMLRGLPDCDHLFHLSCIDPWLRLRPTCPVCRASPLPTPLPTPLAEVVPLSGQS